MSSDLDDVRSPDAYQIGEEFHQAMRRCRMTVRKCGFLLRMTRAERSDLIERTSRLTRR